MKGKIEYIRMYAHICDAKSSKGGDKALGVFVASYHETRGWLMVRAQSTCCVPKSVPRYLVAPDLL